MANLDTGYSAAGVAKTYTTIAAAFAACDGAGGDNIQAYYSNASASRFWAENINSNTTTGVSLEGMLDKRQLVFYTYAAQNFYYISGDLSGITTQLVMQNFVVMAPENKYIFIWNDTTGGGAGLRVTNVVGIGGFMFYRVLAGDANVCQADNCCTVSAEYAIYTDQPTYVYYNTCVGTRVTAYDGQASASTFTNNIGMWSGGQDFDDMGSATVSYNLSSDATATGVGSLTNKTETDIDFWSDNNNGHEGHDYRIVSTSDAYQAGTPIGGITTDCDGNTRDASNPSIGWHEGTSVAYPATAPTFASGVAVTDGGDRTLTVTFDAASANADRYHVAIHTASISSANLDARTYDAVVVDEDGSANYTVKLATTAGGAALLTSGTEYYVAVSAWNGATRDTGSDNDNTTVTDPLAAGGVSYVIVSPTPVLLQSTETAIYTCPAGYRAKVDLWVANLDTVKEDVTIYKKNSGESAGDANTQAKTMHLADAGSETDEAEGPFPEYTLDEGDALTGLCNTNDKVCATITKCVLQTL